MLNLHSLILGSKSPEIDYLQYFRISKVAHCEDQSTPILTFLSLRAKEEKCKDQDEIFSRNL